MHFDFGAAELPANDPDGMGGSRRNGIGDDVLVAIQ
jgi:hypothetical protein